MSYTIDRFTMRVNPALQSTPLEDPAGRPLWFHEIPDAVNIQDPQTIGISGDWFYITRMSAADVDVIVNSRVVGEPLKFMRLRAGLCVNAQFSDLRIVGVYAPGLLDIQFGTGQCPIQDTPTPAQSYGYDVGAILLARGMVAGKSGSFTYDPLTPAFHPMQHHGDIVSIAGYIGAVPAAIMHLTLCLGQRDPVSGIMRDGRPLMTFTLASGIANGVPVMNEPVRSRLNDFLFWRGYATGAATIGALTGYIQASYRGHDEIQG